VKRAFCKWLKKILIYLSAYEERQKQRTATMPERGYTEQVEIVPCEDGWQGIREDNFRIEKKLLGLPMDKFVLN